VLERITELTGTLPALIGELSRLRQELDQLARRAPATARHPAGDAPGPPRRCHHS
jgi:hypothetical protein